MSNMDIFTTLIFNITTTMIATTIIKIILIIFNITITMIATIVLIFTTKDRLVPSRQQ